MVNIQTSIISNTTPDACAPNCAFNDHQQALEKMHDELFEQVQPSSNMSGRSTEQTFTSHPGFVKTAKGKGNYQGTYTTYCDARCRNAAMNRGNKGIDTEWARANIIANHNSRQAAILAGTGIAIPLAMEGIASAYLTEAMSIGQIADAIDLSIMFLSIFNNTSDNGIRQQDDLQGRNNRSYIEDPYNHKWGSRAMPATFGRLKF
ncbi:hypothetical protein [Catenovulum adriaticum]|uniref:Uncharacterized protein n=1 Tax=Catenovulum adriaticum TaxID=2984846 RepID=A0ABY7AL98_9ALTE|nr:hypothetical protein [Catenovulum sp. TS8]WAJ70327.1 hypothetical protein OLW01_00485 [Catenovulum sp. TS8]